MSDSEVNKIHTKSEVITEASNSAEGHTEGNSRSLTTSTELLVEFLSSIMTKDYEMALKYCSEILSHEPNNTTALEFYPLIVEKLEIIKNELDNTSSDSSPTSSSTSSSSSETGPFHNELLGRKSTYEWKRIYSSHPDEMGVDKINGSIVSYPIASEKGITNETKRSVSLGPKSENNFRLLPKEELNKRVPGNVTSLPSNLLAHSSQTVTFFGKNTSNMESRNLPSSQQDKQIPTISQEQPSSKRLLHTIPTLTFPKGLPTRSLARTENPQ